MSCETRSRMICDDGRVHMTHCTHSKPYGCFSFLFDAFMVLLTAGFWLIWIFVREMRKR